MHSCILDVPDPIQTQVRIPLAQKDGSYGNSISGDITERELNLSNVIDESGHRQHIECAKSPLLVNQKNMM